MENDNTPRRKLHPEIAGILGIFGIIIVIAFIMCAVSGRFEQWFGWTVFTGPKATDSVVYAEGDENSSDLIVFDMFKETKTTILEDTRISEIAVSPTGGKIAYISPVNDIDQVFTIGPTGKKNKALTHEGYSKSKPSFSPDGMYITYISKGKLYKTDINGGTTHDLIPTRQQLQQFINERGETLSCKNYVWAYEGDGMLAVVSKGKHKDRFVVVMHGNDAHEIPFPDEMYLDIDSLFPSRDGSFYIATGVMYEQNDTEKPVYTVFIVQIPAEHTHEAGAEGADLSFAPVYQVNAPISNAVLPLDNGSILLAINGKDALNGVVELDPEEKKITGLFPMFYDVLDSPYFANGLFCKKDGLLDYFDFEMQGKTTISEKCNSFALSRKSANKAKMYGGPNRGGEEDEDDHGH
ncbi:MAG: hypothetical protein ILO36_02590 [Abditibacteriota bacterium]|nr:hypothetical protein [Abditibacteriota bacterium]